MELNREHIKKELVLFIDDMPVELHFSRKRTLTFSLFLKDILFVILANEQKIFELENRLKECENGYEGTLFLDRCKLYDAEQKIKELAEDNKAQAETITNLIETIKSVCGVKEEYETFIGGLKPKIDGIRADTVREMHSILYEEFLKVARCQKSGEPNMKSQEVFAILDQTEKEMLEGI